MLKFIIAILLIIIGIFIFRQGMIFLDERLLALGSLPGAFIIVLALAPLTMGTGLVMAVLKWPAARYWIKFSLLCIAAGLILFGILKAL